MAYGRYKSYAGFKSSYNAGKVKITVNHFQIHELLKNVKSKTFLYPIYALKIILPVGTVFLLNNMYPTKWVWIPAILHLLLSYLMEMQIAEFSIGGIVMLVGFMRKNGLLITLGAPFVVEFIVSKLVWGIIESTVANEVMEDKEHFDNMWDKELIMYENEDVLYSVNRSVKINRGSKNGGGTPMIPDKKTVDKIAREENEKLEKEEEKDD